MEVTCQGVQVGLHLPLSLPASRRSSAASIRRMTAERTESKSALRGSAVVLGGTGARVRPKLQAVLLEVLVLVLPWVAAFL